VAQPVPKWICTWPASRSSARRPRRPPSRLPRDGRPPRAASVRPGTIFVDLASRRPRCPVSEGARAVRALPSSRAPSKTTSSPEPFHLARPRPGGSAPFRGATIGGKEGSAPDSRNRASTARRSRASCGPRGPARAPTRNTIESSAAAVDPARSPRAPCTARKLLYRSPAGMSSTSSPAAASRRASWRTLSCRPLTRPVPFIRPTICGTSSALGVGALPFR